MGRKAASDSVKKVMVAGQSTDLGARVAGSGLVVAGANDKYKEPTPLDKTVAAAESLAARVGRALPLDKTVAAAESLAARVGRAFKPSAPKPIGNSQKDSHNKRAAEFALSEADRQRLYARLDRMTAAEKASKRR